MKIIHSFLLKIFFVVIYIIFQITYCDAEGKSIDSLKTRLSQAQTTNEKAAAILKLSELTGDTDKRQSLVYAEELMLLAHKVKLDTLTLKAQLNLAKVNLLIGNYPRALDLYQQVANSKIAPSNDLSKAYNGIGVINYYQKDFKNAEIAYKKALYYYQVMQSQAKEKVLPDQSLLNNMGILYEEMRDYEKSDYYYSESLRLSRKLHNEGLIAHTLTNYGRLFHKQGKNDLALKYYMEALAIRQHRKNKSEIALSYDGLGEFYLELKNYSIAEKYLKQAIELAQQNGDLLTVKRSSENLYKLYQKLENYKLAFDALILNKQASDSLFNDERANKIRQLKTEFEFERRHSEDKANQREKELTYLMIGIGLVLLLIIVSLLFFLQRNKVHRSLLEQAHLKLEKESLEKDIKLKDKELTTSTIHLMQKNELIDDISDKLLKIKPNMDIEYQQAIQRVVTDLQSNLRPELLKEFEFRFQQVHEEFFDILNAKFPNLTPSERKLCAFLKLGMTTKEISAITYQNIKAIEIARTRLRKKLNLTNQDQNLVIFLSQLSHS
ncbi:tetratricopeptide repeat protein [Sphingobacterium multivorum]|nr:tetratricopeptide repeat protein [Sphingobacterium multivorum]QQT31906.1 tetratricopeptide repeat protein [Sphingobacterium multivorum]